MASTTWQRALVTGASSGIGAAYARRLAKQGTDVVLVARRADALRTLAEDLQARHGVRCEALAADLATEDGIAAVEAAVGDVDLLVSNAGYGISARLLETDPADVEGMVRLNVLAVARLARAALPGMVARRHGAIVHVSSVAGFQPSPSFATYNATKSFVTMFTECLSIEVKGTGVRVQALCPGLTRTGFQSVAGETGTDGLPDLMWQTADEVVDASLAGQRRNKVLVVSGAPNKALIGVSSVMPHGLKRRVAAFVMERRGR
jgi:short-subunit dehydrogenase